MLLSKSLWHNSSGHLVKYLCCWNAKCVVYLLKHINLILLSVMLEPGKQVYGQIGPRRYLKKKILHIVRKHNPATGTMRTGKRPKTRPPSHGLLPGWQTSLSIWGWALVCPIWWCAVQELHGGLFCLYSCSLVHLRPSVQVSVTALTEILLMCWKSKNTWASTLTTNWSGRKTHRPYMRIGWAGSIS